MLCFVYATFVHSQHIISPMPVEMIQLSSVDKVFVSTFRLDGNTVFSDADFDPLLAPFTNREITPEQLQEVRNIITQHYVKNGYVNSGAIIPDQDVEDGRITIRIIEGKLSQINVTGNSRLKENYIRKRIEIASGRGELPLNINTIQERLKIIKQDPRIKNLNALLEPGLELGDSVLNVDIEEQRPYQVGFRFNNRSSPNIGAYRGEIYAQHLNLSGWGDSLSAQYGITEGLDDYSIKYTIPITHRETTFSIGTDQTRATVVAEPFYSKDLDIRSDTTSYFASLRHPLYRTESQEFAVGLKFDKRHSETTLLGIPFSFPGSGSDDNGETDFYVFRFNQDWVDRSLNHVIAAYSSFNFGQVDGGTLDGGFFSWLGQFQWLRRIPVLNSQLLFSLNLQLTGDTLVSAEKYAVGGAYTVRGYRENYMTTDNGVVGSLEWRVPVFNLKIPKVSKGPHDGEFQVCPFFDIGKSWNTDDKFNPDSDTISSAGVGVRWVISPKISAEIYWGKALKDVPEPTDKDIQDNGIHFQISAEVF